MFVKTNTKPPMVNINLFSQILGEIPRDSFQKIANEHQSDKHSKGIDTWAHLVSMLFCQLSGADSLRSITGGLLSTQGNLNHLGLKKAPSRSNLSYINAHRSYEVFRDFYFVLFDHLCSKHTFIRKKLKRLKRPIYLMDASMLPLCLKLFDWARYRTTKGAAKLHMVLDYDGCLPVFAHLSDGKKHEINVAKTISFPKGSLILFDRGYIDYKWMNDLDSSHHFFVTRAKENMAYEILEENFIPPDKTTTVLKDVKIRLVTSKAVADYPNTLRLVIYLDSITAKEYTFLTNNLSWNAQTIADCYKERWNIEVFFKQLKQQLNVKSFLGTSENAVQIQLWTALCAILILKYLQEIATYKWNLSNMATFIRLHLFAKTDLMTWINHPFFIQRPPPKTGQTKMVF